MIQYETIKQAMGVDVAVSHRMAQAIYRWSKMYINESPWLNDDVKGLNLPAAICSEMARLVTMESSINITGGSKAEMIKEGIQPFLNEISNYTEFACSTGGVVFKPYLSQKGIEIDVVRAGDFYPVEFNSAGEITAAIFPEFKRVGKNLYTRLEYHALHGSMYSIVNKAFISKKAMVKADDIINLGREINLEEVPEWSDIAPYVKFQNADRMLFSYFKIPLANNTDIHSPLGVSIYARAVNQIRDADEQYGAVLWEYKSKETAIQAADEFFRKNRQGEVILPKGKERLYRAMGPNVMSRDGNPFFNAYSPEIRDESFFNGYNRIIQKVEFNCGLAYGTLSDPQVVDKTAEEIKASKQRSYATVKSIQNSLGNALENLVAAVEVWMSLGGIAAEGKVEVSCRWDDSLVTDKKYETEQLRADFSLGVVGPVEYRMKRFGETEEQAIKMWKQASQFSFEDTME
ncbi:phage capsid protein [Mediterraneibacter gnavus]|uniref:phage capsid protein n=2 Tax=Mediterraneibacter gnavus TaxID=33038 RepID=UPI00232CE908|nr:phage capsid protein [Mediterraneibacter gnavus]MDB8712122.1 phage capsid protein [Mediterraneibacter gnavus]MDB8715158.1 phage capsid protein [Mediterraneibacter gnavus]